MSIVKKRPEEAKAVHFSTEDAWLYTTSTDHVYDSMSFALELDRTTCKLSLHWCAYELGVQAFNNKESVTECPALVNRGLEDTWKAGWMDALADKVHDSWSLLHQQTKIS